MASPTLGRKTAMGMARVTPVTMMRTMTEYTVDNCPHIANKNQTDFDSDGWGTNATTAWQSRTPSRRTRTEMVMETPVIMTLTMMES